MKVCFFGLYDASYSRNKILLDGLRQHNIEVIECNNLGEKGIKKYFNLIKKLRAIRNEYDVLFCTFPINYNVLIATLFQKRPIVIDAFFPLYDAYVEDRRTLSKFHPLALVYWALDRINLLLADVVIADTEQHKAYWRRLHKHVPIEVVYVGAHSEEFYPIELSPRADKKTLVTFQGSYIPLQGVDKIIDAAAILKDNPEIAFRFIGRGQEYESAMKRITELGLTIEIMPWLSIEALNQKLNESDIILGIFGETSKTDRVIPNKVFQGLAVGKPVITKDTPAIRELFTSREIIMTNNNPANIAQAILEHRNYQPERRPSSFTEREVVEPLIKMLRSL